MSQLSPSVAVSEPECSPNFKPPDQVLAILARLADGDPHSGQLRRYAARGECARSHMPSLFESSKRAAPEVAGKPNSSANNIHF